MHELALLLPLLLAAPLPEPATASHSPYQLTVCLRVADDPLLSERFVRGVSREVRDQLRNFFGPLADVTVLTSGHWLIDDYADDDVDLPFVDNEIMEARELTEQAFVFRISFDRTRYHIRWRQLDGATGQVGPIISKQTPDRLWVAKTICLAVRDDFAVRATITPGSTPGSIQVSFVGKEHQPYLQRVVGQRMFMQLYWVAKRRTGVARTTVPQTLVLWTKDKDRYSAEIVSTYASPWSRKAGVSYEASRIHTQPGRLRLRLVDQERSTPVTNRTVSANDRGFDSLTDGDILPRADRQGILLSPNVLNHVAYVRIDQGGGAVVNVPLPITQDICDHVLPIAADKQLLAKNDYERNLRFLTQDLQTLSTIQSAAVTSANEFNGRKRYEDALQSVEEVVSVTGQQLGAADRTVYELQQQAAKLQIKDTKQLDFASAGLKQLQDRHRELSELHATIGSAIEKRDAQGRASVLIKLGEQAERDADFEEALTRYRLALGEQPDQPALTKRVHDLEEQWRIQGPDHEAAREFAYGRWASAEITEIEPLLPEAKAAWETLKSVSDSLTARKLLNANGAHLAALNDLVARLAERTSDEDRKETDKYVAVTEALANFQEALAQDISDRTRQTASEPESDSGSERPAANAPTDASRDATPSASSLLDLDADEEKPLDDNLDNQ